MRTATYLMLGIAFAGLPFVVGCEEETYRETEVDVDDDGTVKKEQTTVTRQPDGSVKTTETKTKTNPDLD